MDVVVDLVMSMPSLHRVNLHLDLELAGCEGALETLRVACTGLGEAKELCASVGASLQKKRDQIREFTQLSVSIKQLGCTPVGHELHPPI